eukprot:TRINITY_DN7156_c0_g1_i1.p1 TRINITY_DN7156_c0_g1~~TRINITY_DN7156_c0_g1_i1.p1  ORF type:complete len:342 (-),score=52.12 TRINITY_DN7156_c0_g1_i1:108-1133(-)
MEQHHNVSRHPSVSFVAHENYVCNIVELKDETLLSCAADYTIKRWTTKGHLLHIYCGHSDSVYCLMELDDNNTFLSGSEDGFIKVWNTATGECLHTLAMDRDVHCLLKLSNNTSFLCGMGGGMILEKNIVANYETLHTLDEHYSAVTCMCELHNGWVVSGSFGDTLLIWNMKRKVVIQRLSGHGHAIVCVIELRDMTIASSSDDKTIRIWDVTTGDCLQVLKESDYATLIIRISDELLLSGTPSGKLREWNRQGEVVWRLLIDCSISCMVQTKRSRSLVVGTYTGTIEIRREVTLVDLCCQVIAKNQNEYDVTSLKNLLPGELYDHIKQEQLFGSLDKLSV